MSGGDWGAGILEEGREKILEWREKRLKQQENRHSFRGFSVYLFNVNTLCSFMHNFNYMVLMHMTLAGVAVYLAKKFSLSYDIQLALLISPIVFPLAFAINADFHRRDTVLEKISHFESSGMVLYMCMREWRKDTGLKHEWINSIHDKLKSLLFLLREYLFTDEGESREYIMRYLYEDFSDVSQMIEQMRTSKLPTNGPLVSRAIHLLSLMCLSFEQLRVVKEYRSPRSIRAFNKVLIMLLPIILAPYFVKVGGNEGKNEWAPYFLSIIVAFVFSALQGVQDKLDDPFDGMGEDDIKLNAIDDWTFKSFGATVQRFNVGRFNVSVRKKASSLVKKMSIRKKNSTYLTSNSNINTKGLSRNPSQYSAEQNSQQHPYSNALKHMRSNTCIKTRSSIHNNRYSVCEGDLDVFDGFNALKTMGDSGLLVDDEIPSRPRTVSFDNCSEPLLDDKHKRNASVYSKKSNISADVSLCNEKSKTHASLHPTLSIPADISLCSPEVIKRIDETIANPHNVSLCDEKPKIHPSVYSKKNNISSSADISLCSPDVIETIEETITNPREVSLCNEKPKILSSIYSKKSNISSADVSLFSPDVIETIDEEITNPHENKTLSEPHLLVDSENDDLCSTSFGLDKISFKSLLSMFQEKAKIEYRTIGDNNDDESAFPNGKYFNNFKKGFVIIPIDEETDFYVDEVDEKEGSSTSAVDINIEMCNDDVEDEQNKSILPKEEKDPPSKISLSNCTQPHKRMKLMTTEGDPHKQLLISVDNTTEEEPSDLQEDGPLSTVIDMSGITETVHDDTNSESCSMVNGKFMLACRDADLNQSKDTHSRLP